MCFVSNRKELQLESKMSEANEFMLKFDPKVQWAVYKFISFVFDYFVGNLYYLSSLWCVKNYLACIALRLAATGVI